ncbi:MAG: prephenate dehydrogenase [Terriglobales bacterium]
MQVVRQLTIIGTGLIGGSLALALKKHRLVERVVGCDRAAVLDVAKKRGAIDDGREDARTACEGSDVVVLATPVGAIIDLVEKLGPVLPATTLLTDVGSTKQQIVERARAVFGDRAEDRFLAGHPMAGKEVGGIEQADAELFAGAVWLFTATKMVAELPAGSQRYIRAVEQIGARVIEMDAARHDRLCAWISHLPQFVSTAMAAALEDEFGDDADVHAIGARALREMTRLATSPYSMWRDIAITNEANVQEALLALEQRLAHLRENLRTRELAEEFERAKEFRSRKT